MVQPVHRTAVQAIEGIVAQLAADNIVAQLAADNTVAQLAADNTVAQLAADRTAADADCTHRLVELVSVGDSIQQPEGCLFVSKDQAN